MKRLALYLALFSAVPTLAQGVLYSSVAQAVASIPGSAQGVSNVFVPIPSAQVMVCTGSYIGSPCLTQTASIYQDQAMTVPITPYDVADAYGNFQFWAVSGTYYGTIIGTVAGATVQNNFQFQLPTVGTPAVASINTVTGAFTFTGNGVSCSGTTCAFSTAPTPYYQIVQWNGTAEPQRANLNFSQRFSLSDASGNNQTNVDANTTGNGLFLLSALTSPGTSTALLQFDGAGNGKVGPALLGSAAYVQTVAATSLTEIDNVVGCNFPNDGPNLTCTVAVTLSPPMPDANYNVSCIEYTNPNMGTIMVGNISINSIAAGGYTLEEMTQGSSTLFSTYPNYGKSFVCTATHN